MPTRATTSSFGCARRSIPSGKLARMLDIQLLRGDAADVAKRLATRGFTFDVAAFQRVEAQRKEIQTRTQELQAKRNTASKQIGTTKTKGEDPAALMREVAGLGEQGVHCCGDLARCREPQVRHGGAAVAAHPLSEAALAPRLD